MPILRAVLLLCVPCFAQAGDITIKKEGWRLVHALRALETRHAPSAGSIPMKKIEPPSRDRCVFVAGVRHCPLRHD